jgi:hypothetical protein
MKSFQMPAYDLRKELVAFIDNTNDEELLLLLKEDFVFYRKLKDDDITDDLNEEQSGELKKLSEEDERIDVYSLDEFKRATVQWRTK